MNKESKPDRPEWARELAASPFREPMFTEEMKADILNRRKSADLQHSQGLASSWRRRVPVLTAGICALLLLTAVWGWQAFPALRQLVPLKGPGSASEWTPHTLYTENGEPKLQVFAGGDYAAGAPAGAAWFLMSPIEELEGKHVRITAVHRDSGTILEELAETEITADMAYEGGPDSSFKDATRIVSRFGLPLAGLWKFDLLIDGKKYGDIVFDVPDGSWVPSPSFVTDRSEEEAKIAASKGAPPRSVTGVEGRLAFLGMNFAACKPNKYMWHFWGKDEELTGDLTFTAVKQHSNELIDVFQTEIRPSPMYGADAMLPSMMMLPSPGLWRIMASIDGQLFGSVVVEVR